jgi:glycosyltransferase involved in cell wall biosynthesis
VDHEDHLRALRFADNPQAGERDVAERAQLLEGARGATVIEPRLQETLPSRLPSLVLEPGVDHERFGSPLPAHRRASILKALGVPQADAVLVYPGNIHRANAGEMVELYRAVGRVREQGRRLVLIKTGKDDVDMAALLGADPVEVGVIQAGLLERDLLIDLLKCADLFVQPGAPGPFNDFRLPSKLPEFMAVGRPVVLPAANVGLRLREGEEALLLRAGSAEEIAGKVLAILDDPALAARLAAGAQAFARRTWRWERQGGLLLDFLERLRRSAG